MKPLPVVLTLAALTGATHDGSSPCKSSAPAVTEPAGTIPGFVAAFEAGC